jgi:NAD(P)-dependent dehydrogenase (short-subunit alcohol dehydrogenase family)
MSIATGTSPIQPEPQLAGQTVVVIGGSAGIGLETARLARAQGAKLVLAARNPERLQSVASELAALRSVAFDATDFDQLKRFFDELPTPIDHVLVTGPGPYYAPLAELDIGKARRNVEAHILLPLQVARYAAKKVRPGGTLLAQLNAALPVHPTCGATSSTHRPPAYGAHSKTRLCATHESSFRPAPLSTRLRASPTRMRSVRLRQYFAVSRPIS